MPCDNVTSQGQDAIEIYAINVATHSNIKKRFKDLYTWNILYSQKINNLLCNHFLYYVFVHATSGIYLPTIDEKGRV